MTAILSVIARQGEEAHSDQLARRHVDATHGASLEVAVAQTVAVPMHT
jgi:hypothetical protein